MARLKQYDKQELIDRSQYGGSTFDQQHFTDDELRAAAQARATVPSARFRGRVQAWSWAETLAHSPDLAGSVIRMK